MKFFWEIFYIYLTQSKDVVAEKKAVFNKLVDAFDKKKNIKEEYFLDEEIDKILVGKGNSWTHYEDVYNGLKNKFKLKITCEEIKEKLISNNKYEQFEQYSGLFRVRRNEKNN